MATARMCAQPSELEPVFGSIVAGVSSLRLDCGIRIVVPQVLQRTNFPRAALGTASIRWQAIFGHLIRTLLELDEN